jgi:SAM-dependent methyltransferase
MKKYTAPTLAAKYILFQRTDYIALANSSPFRTIRKVLPFITYNFMVELEAKLRSRKIIDMYFSDMKQEYDSLKHFLPANCSRILDIGCGIAGIDIYINEHYAPQNIEYYLLDKSKIEEKVYYMFEEKGAFYNSLDITKATLVANGINENNIHLIEATENNDIDIKQNVDIVLSLLSWGFHYPVNTYLDKVYALLNRKGVLILDIRKGTDGLDLITKKFGEYRKVLERKKYIRICAIK